MEPGVVVGATVAILSGVAVIWRRAPVSEDVFLRPLSSPAADVARAAIRGLARFGSARAVPLLREAEGRADFARPAREAVVAIQARLTGATPGQVSLSGGDAGRLSVAENADGRVSLEGGTK